MFRQSIVLLGAMALAGCANQGGKSYGSAGTDANGDSQRAAVSRPTDAELAAYAGRTKFPEGQSKGELPIVAIISPDKRTIKIYNLGNSELRNVDVWVNGSYVQHLAGLAPQSSVQIRTDELFNGLGKNFAGQAEPITRVQLQSDQGFYGAWGPAAE